MPPRKTEKEEPKRVEEKVEEPRKAEPQDEPLLRDKDDEPRRSDDRDEAPSVEETVPTATPPVASSQLTGARAVFDTSGTAGAADHDLRRHSAAFDKLAEDRDEVQPHLEKYLESEEGYRAIVDRERERREDA